MSHDENPNNAQHPLTLPAECRNLIHARTESLVDVVNHEFLLFFDLGKRLVKLTFWEISRGSFVLVEFAEEQILYGLSQFGGRGEVASHNRLKHTGEGVEAGNESHGDGQI